ncbi:hypothetical protein BDW02DRAFT_124487 [Decorospora gaudefroyi]|uniref:Uncharacterized protein n=1 Tax=Decorospora gaudefroyi TaxID=184978 RepID=A0A6A5K9D2_9PLEO|nr:hypothetical protein BDW02DRAFT_124487 [Decorospora gaudefroyi]
MALQRDAPPRPMSSSSTNGGSYCLFVSPAGTSSSFLHPGKTMGKVKGYDITRKLRRASRCHPRMRSRTRSQGLPCKSITMVPMVPCIQVNNNRLGLGNLLTSFFYFFRS